MGGGANLLRAFTELKSGEDSLKVEAPSDLLGDEPDYFLMAQEMVARIVQGNFSVEGGEDMSPRSADLALKVAFINLGRAFSDPEVWTALGCDKDVYDRCLVSYVEASLPAPLDAVPR